MHPGQWENLKGAGIQLVNRSTNGSAVLESTSPGTSTPRSTPLGTSTPWSTQSGSATLTFSSPHCLPSVDRGGPLWGQDAGERATAWATWPCLLPTATRDSERTSFYCLGQRPVFGFCFSFSLTFRFEFQGSNVTFYPDSICFLKRHINFQCPQDKESRPIKVRKLCHPECLAIETTTRRVTEHLQNLML